MPTVTYNNKIIPNVVGKTGLSLNFGEGRFSCDFVVVSGTDQGLIDACNDLEEKLTEKFKDLTIVFADIEEYRFWHSDNSALNTTPQLTKIENDIATRLSRMYNFTLVFDLPADQQGLNYRKDSNISYDTSYDSRNTLTISGEYTAGGSNSARENYDSHAITYCSAIAEDFFGSENYELISEKTNQDEDNKNLRFTVIYQEKQDIVVTYNEYSIPGQYFNFQRSEDYDKISVSLDFSVPKTELSSLSALSIKDRGLQISFGDQDFDYNPATNSGFLASPSLRKTDTNSETATNDVYNFSVTIEKPALKDGDGFRRNANFSLGYSTSRQRIFNFSATYTAGGSNNALANYRDAALGGKAWAESVINSFGAGEIEKFELVGETINDEQERKLIDAKLTYKEIFSNNTQSALNDPDIVDAQCSYSLNFMNRQGVSITDLGYVHVPQVSMSLSYSCKLNKDTISIDTDIQGVYRSKIKPYLLGHSKQVLNLSNLTNSSNSIIFENERYSVNVNENVFSGALTLIAPKNLEQIIDYKEVVSDQTDKGISRRKIWDGQPHTYSLWATGESKTRTRTITIRKFGTEPEPPQPLEGNYIKLGDTETKSLEKDGVGSLQDANSEAFEVFLYEKTFVENYLYVENAQGQTILNPEQNELL